ncbi:GEM-like protein 4 [Rhodamnia argentea]|uniref:GEM-like protein 4 n=1 Tax=Rhodamnia argentea TaxID=178133 RepID=A0A8B8NJ72_9MYRT|nr:GEM-like protein 4 [Rhodamnia argentea]
MKNQLQGLVIGVPFLSLEAPSSEHSYQYNEMFCPFDGSSRKLKKNKVNLVLHRMNKLGKKADILARGVREHVSLSPKITKTVEGKLRIGARVLQLGGMDKVFMDLFNVGDGERLMKTFQCYLSTSSGPIGGLLFISNERVAFCSDRCIKLVSPDGETTKVHYKVMIPLRKIKMENEKENLEKPSQKYIQIVTVDNFDFWFMGFLNYQKTLKHLRRAISQT